MVKFNFEKFTNTKGKYGSYSVTISPKYSVMFNSGFFQKEKLFRFKYVILSYDTKEKAVAFTFQNKQEDGVFTLVARGSFASIVARSFFLAHDIRLDSTLKFKPVEYENELQSSTFYIQLSESIGTGRK